LIVSQERLLDVQQADPSGLWESVSPDSGESAMIHDRQEFHD
jgi:hypothetical protein